MRTPPPGGGGWLGCHAGVLWSAAGAAEPWGHLVPMLGYGDPREGKGYVAIWTCKRPRGRDGVTNSEGQGAWVNGLMHRCSCASLPSSPLAVPAPLGRSPFTALPSIGGGARRPLTSLCHSSASLAYLCLSASPSFPLVGKCPHPPGGAGGGGIQGPGRPRRPHPRKTEINETDPKLETDLWYTNLFWVSDPRGWGCRRAMATMPVPCFCVFGAD